MPGNLWSKVHVELFPILQVLWVFPLCQHVLVSLFISAEGTIKCVSDRFSNLAQKMWLILLESLDLRYVRTVIAEHDNARHYILEPIEMAQFDFKILIP